MKRTKDNSFSTRLLMVYCFVVGPSALACSDPNCTEIRTCAVTADASSDGPGDSDASREATISYTTPPASGSGVEASDASRPPSPESGASSSSSLDCAAACPTGYECEHSRCVEKVQARDASCSNCGDGAPDASNVPPNVAVDTGTDSALDAVREALPGASDASIDGPGLDVGSGGKPDAAPQDAAPADVATTIFKTPDGEGCTTDPECATGHCTLYFKDEDGDGYPVSTVMRGWCGVTTPSKNAKYIPVRADGQWDCCDAASSIHPGSEKAILDWSRLPAECNGKPGDANCDGTVEILSSEVTACELRNDTCVAITTPLGCGESADGCDCNRRSDGGCVRTCYTAFWGGCR